MISSFLIVALIAAEPPVAVPGPVCAVPDGDFTIPRDGLTIGDEAYFKPACAPMTAPADLLFDFNSAVLKPTAAPFIAQWASSIAGREGNFYIDGHADWIGSDVYNFNLSMKRAGAVRDAIVKLGIDATRLVVRGFGESRPIATNRTAEGRSRNRRVEVLPVDR